MILASLSLLTWLYLVFFHGSFWRSVPQLPAALPAEYPDVDVVVPARDEAAGIAPVIASLILQEYAGNYRILLVDDNSTDGTAEKAGVNPRLTIIRLISKPGGWSGKLWALNEGVAAGTAPLLFFTDADIVHDPRHLCSLVAHMQASRCDMVSEMVHLNCTSLAERALVPAFVYFFQMLYPFSRVNNPADALAAAAGGTVLIRREALARMGGLHAIRHTLIDDVTLAKAVKRNGSIYLGHSALASSIRPYPGFGDIWRMIARTAFTQLHHSWILLALTLCALSLVWLIPVWALLFGHGYVFVVALVTCLLAAGSYVPTLRRYQRTALWAFALPLIAMFYMAATVGSAVNFRFGRGNHWKSRSYG
jgi:hopene-associated glycosyltransferase HpnB